MPLNWFIEWLKWKTIVASKNISLRVRWHSFLSGIVSGVVTPAYAGNFIGRIFYFDKEDRKEIILNTLVSNGSQFIISITLGIGSFAILYSTDISRLEHVLNDINSMHRIWIILFWGHHFVQNSIKIF